MFEELKEKYPRWMFMSVVGSHNYGTAIEGSDTDVKLAYLPTFEEFYRNSYTHVDKSGPDVNVDYTVHPVHEFLHHAFKGNINFWEVMFSESLEINWKWWESSGEMRMFFSLCRDVVTDSPLDNFNAMRGMAIQKNLEALKYSSRFFTAAGPEYVAKMWKSAQHSVRLLDMILVYQSTGNLCLNLFDTPFVKPNIEWDGFRTRTNDSGFELYRNMFERKLKLVDGLENIFKEHHNSVDVRSNRESCREIVDSILMRLIKENS